MTPTVPSLQERRQILSRLKTDLENNKQVFALSGLFKLTKTENLFSSVFLYRDLELEQCTREYLEKTVSFTELISRYQNYDNSLNWMEWPRHYAVRILSGTGPISCGKNIFAFFPEAMRLLPRDKTDVFGLEFIDVWENVFRKIVLPCARRVFDLQTQFEIYQTLEMNLSRTIFLAAVFHEMGHRCGPWKVSPHFNPEYKLNSHHWGVMGEISTDSLLVNMLKEFPEVALFVTLQRLFWFGRRGTSENPVSGLTNSDNDAWLGSWLWNKLVHTGAVSQLIPDQMWSLNRTRLHTTFQQITLEIDEFSQTVLANQHDQDEQISEWMKTKVDHHDSFGFVIPAELRAMFNLCNDIPDQAHFRSPFANKDMTDLGA